MSESLQMICPVCGAAISSEGERCVHVQFLYSYDQARFLFLSLDLAEAIARADAQQAGCADAEWRSLPELAYELLAQREQVVVLDCQQRGTSWVGWLLGLDAKARAAGVNALPFYDCEPIEPLFDSYSRPFSV
ncbi:hypothetical protein [Synechococcus elongatus]|uniref:STAS/SEC14 domain-containing protein n=1 Tax=Synechococcus elongatus PCC 11802 TaxID=2283154 RepID=A0AAU6R5T9_SYNEL|nr:hypothetical protein [Synechococcus elongatus]QFZ92217.1 hypothetical protein EKO22_07430 [Synechococcus elongatus PCC 11802]